MSRFFYIARDKFGEKSSGLEEAGTQDEVVSRLQAKDLVVISVISADKSAIGLKADIASKTKLTRKHLGVSGDDLVLFCRQLSTLLSAGVTILKSLEIISQQVSSFRLFNIIKSMQKSMEAGLSFHEALAKHPAVFSDLWINLAESGEASGNLAMILSRLATYLERNAAFKRKIISAVIYPALLFIVGIGALLFLTIKIVPTFADLFKGFNVQLPFLTVVLITVSDFIRKAFILVLFAIIIGFFAIKKYISTKEGKRKYEKLQFGLPVFGEFFRVLVMERFTSEMSTLVESGIPILYSLEITEHSVGNLTMAEIIRNIKDNVREGKPLSIPMEKSGFFEPMAVQMVAIGEEIGELSSMFKKLNGFYQEYVETFLVRFTALFEPFMLIFMGLIIGVLVIGMFLPIFQISQIGG